jgi:hypothetical protein
MRGSDVSGEVRGGEKDGDHQHACTAGIQWKQPYVAGNVACETVDASVGQCMRHAECRVRQRAHPEW